jgi:hypothetical protein
VGKGLTGSEYLVFEGLDSLQRDFASFADSVGHVILDGVKPFVCELCFLLRRRSEGVEGFGVLVAGEQVKLDVKIVEQFLNVVIGLMRGGNIANHAVGIGRHNAAGGR